MACSVTNRESARLPSHKPFAQRAPFGARKLFGLKELSSPYKTRVICSMDSEEGFHLELCKVRLKLLVSVSVVQFRLPACRHNVGPTLQ